jgi:Putative peptidoglycan binding domain
MKKILLASVIATLSIAVLVMALKLRRLGPPEDYEYHFRTEIDADYYDQAALRDYYATGYAVGSFAREMWKERGINVRFPESDNTSDQVATLHYNGLKAYCDSLGARLSRSLQLKSRGLTNANIKVMEATGMGLEDAVLAHTYGATQLHKGERSPGVLTLQQQLITLGYVMPSDGYFWIETEVGIREFQAKQKLLATGDADAQTLRAISKSVPIKTH